MITLFASSYSPRKSVDPRRWTTAALLCAACAHQTAPDTARAPLPPQLAGCIAGGLREPSVIAMRDRAVATHTSGLYLSQNGVRIIDERFDGSASPLDLMSATKGIVALGVGSLVHEGRLRGLDGSVQTLLPTLAWPDSQPIRLRHLLAHVSGLKTSRTTQEIYAAPDFVRYAVSLPLASPPGARFFYNNAAVNLLAPVFSAISGQRMDEYIAQRVLQPAGVRESLWLTDAFLWNLRQTGVQDASLLHRGNPVAMAHLFLTPHDFGLVGELLLSELRLPQPRHFPPDFLRELQRPGQPFDVSSSLLWWLVRDPNTPSLAFDARQRASLPRTGLPEGLVDELSTLDGSYTNPRHFSLRLDGLRTVQRMGGRLTLRRRLFELGFSGSLLRVLPTPVVGIAARGTYGQYLVVVPSAGLVGVRMIHSERWTGPDDDFADFEYLVASVASARGCAEASRATLPLGG